MIQRNKKTVDERLAESFKTLACQMPVEKITIKQITDKAGVIRPTFYNHFEDKYNLLEWILITDIVNPAMPLLNTGMIKEALILISISRLYIGVHYPSDVVMGAVLGTIIAVIFILLFGKRNKKMKKAKI